MATGGSVLSVHFEVFGKVQGVFFRKNTKKTADSLKLVGWVKNTYQGTVKGYMEGPPEQISKMKHWLSYVGSKSSKIDKAEFRDEKSINTCTMTEFVVRH